MLLLISIAYLGSLSLRFTYSQIKFLYFFISQGGEFQKMELNILLNIFSKKLRNRILGQLLSNFDAQKSNFVLSGIELLFIKNIL